MIKIKKGKKEEFIKFVLIRLFVNAFIECMNIMMRCNRRLYTYTTTDIHNFHF